MFYVNEKPEDKFLAAEIIKLYCIILYCKNSCHNVNKSAKFLQTLKPFSFSKQHVAGFSSNTQY